MNDCSPALHDQAALMPAEVPVAHHRRRPPLRLVLIALGLACAMVAVALSPIRLWVQDAHRVREAVASLGVWGYPACILAVAILVGCGVPRLIFCAVGGMILGFWWGLTVVQAGTLLGYYAVFLFVRWGGRDWVMHRWPSLSKWSDMMRGQGFVAVLLARQLPLHGTFVNLILGLSRVRHRHFLFGSAIGMFPEAIPLTLIGAGVVKSMGGNGRYVGIAAILFAALWIAAGYGLTVLRKNRSAPNDEAAPGQP
jgi:uncharacterized membrane protein YdjX (TVP38/TMEM64 family)